MAVVKDFYIGNTHVKIHDDAYAHLSPEELKQRQETVRRNISNMVLRALEKQAEQKQ